MSFSDNITKTRNGPSDTTFTIGGSGGFFKDEGRPYANVLGSAWYEDSLDDAYKGDLPGALAAFLRCDLVPEMVGWSLDDPYGPTTANQLPAATPGNRTNANYFSTGANLALRLGQVSGVRIGGRYELSNFEQGVELDEARLRGNVGPYRPMSGATTVSFNGSVSRTDFKNGTVPVDAQFAGGYHIRESFGRFETRRTRYAFSIDAGETQVEQLNVKEYMPRLRLDFYRRLTPSLNLNAGQEYRSASDMPRDSIAGVRIVNNQIVYVPPGIDPSYVCSVLNDVNTRSQPVKYEYDGGSLAFTRPRTVFTVSASGGQERLQFSGRVLDRDTWNARASCSRRLRPNLIGTATLSCDDRKCVTFDGEDRTTSGSLLASSQYTSQVAFNAGYRYEKRNSDIGGAFSSKENALFVSVKCGRAKPSMFANPTGKRSRRQSAPDRRRRRSARIPRSPPEVPPRRDSAVGRWEGRIPARPAPQRPETGPRSHWGLRLPPTIRPRSVALPDGVAA